MSKLGFERVIEDDLITYYRGEEKLFWLKETEEENGVRLVFSGEMLSETVHEFRDELMAFASVGVNMIIDFKEIKYMAVAYMQALLEVQVELDKAQKKDGSQSKNAEMKLINVPQTLYDEMEKTGVTELLLIE